MWASIALTGFSTLSRWGGTSPLLGALMVATGVGLTVVGVARSLRALNREPKP